MGIINKKGELTSKQIITILILIVSFAVILIFLFSLNLGKETGREACKQSVELRGVALLGKFMSFNCNTEYICISGGGKCEGVPEKTSIVKVSNSDSNEELLKELLNLRESCFWQFGEAEINIGDGVCGLCSVVYFDEFLKGREEITAEENFQFLESNSPKGKEINYIQYFYRYNTWDELKAAADREGKVINGIDFSQNYMVYYRYGTKYAIGFAPYNSQEINNLKCDSFATVS